MTEPKIPVTEDELHAYIDNELPPERRVSKGTPILATYWGLLANRDFVAWAIVAGIATTVPFAFVTAAPFVFTHVFSLSSHQYSLLLAINAGCSIAATQFAPGLMRRLGGQRLVLRITLVALAATTLMALWAYRAPVPLAAFQLFSMALFAFAGLMLTPAAITALDATRGGAGAAAGLLGTIQLVVTAVASTAVSLVPALSIRPLVAILGTALLIALLLAASQQRPRLLDKQGHE